MTIDRNVDGSKTQLKISGRLDTSTAPELESTIDSCLAGVEELIMDFEKKFDIEIPDDDAGDKIATVGDAIKYIEDKVNA